MGTDDVKEKPDQQDVSTQSPTEGGAQPSPEPPKSTEASDTMDALKKEIDELKKQVTKTVDPEIVKSLLDKVESLSQTLEFLKKQEEERKQKEEEERLKRMSETERLKHLLEKKEEEIERAKKEIEQTLGKRTEELEARLKAYEEERARLAQAAAKARALEVATRLGAYNPEQVYAMVRDVLVTGDDGEVYARVPDGSGDFKQVPLNEYMKDFLNRPENKNLLKTNAAVGEGEPTKEEGSTPTTATPSGEEIIPFEKLPKEEQEKYATEAAFRGVPPDAFYYREMAKKRAAERWKKRHLKK